jgi:serine/threonine protein kinase
MQRRKGKGGEGGGVTATEGESPVTGGEPTRALGSAYVLYERIGRGASGEVWRGLDSRTGAPVAVKLLRSVFAEHADIVEGFLRERTILMRLHDPHIVRLRDLVVESDTVALVTDFAAGGDLRPRLADGPLPLLEALDILSQVLDGLDAAHRRGVVHRDLKPENVLVEGHGDDMLVRITDFGIATLIGSTESSDPLSLVGSPEYMAPEVIEVRQTTPAADLYSAGILLYELLAGHTPFAGGAPMVVLRRHVHDEPARIAAVRDDVWDVVSALLAKDPADRPPSARAAARRLRAIADDVAGVTRPDPFLDDADLDVAPRDPFAVPDWDRSSDEDTTVVGAHREAAARRRRRVWAVAVIAIVVAMAGAGTAIGLSAVARHRQERVAHVQLTGVPGLRIDNFGAIAVVTRTLDLSGRAGDRLTVTLRVRNVGDRDLSQVYEPKLKTENAIPLYMKLAPHQATTITYGLRLERGPLDVDRLLSLERQFGAVRGAVVVTLASARADPRVLQLLTGQRSFLNVSGLTTIGGTAPGSLLAGLEWTSSNPSVADVAPGTVAPGTADARPIITAHRAGAVVISAQLGLEALEVHVAVAPGAGGASGTPCEPGVGDSEALTSIADKTYITDGANLWLILGGARLPVTAGLSFGATTVPLPNEAVASIASIPRSGTKLHDAQGGGWQIVAGSRVNATDVPADVPSANLEGIPVFHGEGITFTDGALVKSVQSGIVWRYLDKRWAEVSNACNASAVPELPSGTRQLPP